MHGYSNTVGLYEETVNLFSGTFPGIHPLPKCTAYIGQLKYFKIMDQLKTNRT